VIEIKKDIEQLKRWKSEFGKEYTDRNTQTYEEMEEMVLKTYGYTRTEINEEFIGNLNHSIRILEVACNIGNQLLCLQKMGFTSLYGIDIQDYAVELSKSRTVNINIIQGSADDIPFKDGFFDLVFTSGLLIHISPSNIEEVLKEIHRCTKKYILGLEYYAEEYEEVKYRGHDKLLWKTDFPKLYLDTFKDLKLIKQKRYKYLDNDNEDIMFLLKKI